MIGDYGKAAEIVEMIQGRVNTSALEEIKLSLSSGTNMTRLRRLFTTELPRGIFYSYTTKSGESRRGEWIECESLLGPLSVNAWERATRVARLVALHYASERVWVLLENIPSPVAEYLEPRK
ncbi:hypothetical protein FJZ19_01185 [Candidatus Pacearchaeota archaeon]|nr:hypothetical protein [Candidatus Pacearchaeota archaeon]